MTPAVPATTPGLHPRPDDRGRPVRLARPSRPGPLEAWHDPRAIACVVPDGPMPSLVNGIAVASWKHAPATPDGWEALAAQASVAEPAFVVPSHLRPAAGVVIREPDGRYWIVCPSNAFGGYVATFPKGKLDGKSPQATALCEAWEESGLQVRLLRHLVDVRRSTSMSRYYLAERVSGTPADMGWESQAVMLVPAERLAQVASHPNDRPILAALRT